MTRRLRTLLVASLAALAAPAVAQDAAFAVTLETLLHAEGAPVLIRAYDTEFVVDGPGRATQHVRLVVTALGPAGREFASWIQVPHGGFRRIRRLDGTLRDSEGAVVRRLGRRDAEDRAVTAYSFQDDLQVREAELWSDAYPYTVEWTYEVEHRGVLSWPAWRPQQEGWPVEAASFRLAVPTDTPVRTHRQRLDVEPVVATADRRTTYTWTLPPTGAFVVEPLGPGWESQVPTLFLGTTQFEIGGSEGQGDTWAGLAAWYGRLSAERDVLPDAARAEVQQIVADAPTQREAVRRLYQHLQRTTRYVSIQLGLGGWQPYDAATVFELRYGDCKALVNYMAALLREAGILAEPVLIAAGEDAPDLEPEFPRNAFNHVILRVELDDGEVIWLECTSSIAAFGHLGAFTADRYALRVTEDGGELVRTPPARPDDNLVARTVTARLDEGGQASVDARWRFAGDARSDVIYALADRLDADRARWLHATTGLPGFDLEAFDLSGLTERPDTLALGATLQVANYARRAGRRLLVPLRPLTEAVAVPPEVEERTQAVHLGTPRLERDEVLLVLPDGYSVEALPEPVAVETAFGRYDHEVRLSDDGMGLVVRRHFEIDGSRQPAEAYAEVRAFYQSVALADGAHAVIARAP